MMELDPQDPFESVVIELVDLNRVKRADYASDTNIFKNFERVVEMLGLEGYSVSEDILAMVCRKVQRIVNLRGRAPTNESVQDSWKDLAVYAMLGYAYLKQSFEEFTDG